MRPAPPCLTSLGSFPREVFQQGVRVFPESTELRLDAIAFEAETDAKSARKLAKSMLKVGLPSDGRAFPLSAPPQRILLR